MIYFKFNDKKATQAAGYLLKLYGGKINYYVLSKLMYQAERESFKRWDLPFTGDCFSSMPWGPVLSTVVDFIYYKNNTTKYWMDNISKAQDYDYDILLKNQNIEDDELSPREERLLKEIYEKNKDKNWNEIKDDAHNLPEWENPGQSSKPLGIQDLLIKLGKDSNAISRIEDNSILYDQLEKLSRC